MQSITLNAKGLYTNPSALSAPRGALTTALNVVIDRPGLVQSRRGYYRLDNSSGSATRLFEYDSNIIAITSTSAPGDTIKRTADLAVTAWTTYYGAGSYAPVDASYVRQSFAIAKRNLYFTTAAGIYRISTAAGIPELAGQVTAPGFVRASCVVKDGTATGFNWLADQYDVAYRYLIFKKDGYSDLLLGPASGRFVFTNSAGATRAVTVRVQLPAEIQNSNSANPYYYNKYFIQLFRSAAAPTGTGPSDDLQQVYEIAITSTDVTNGYKEIDDYTPDSLRQGFLYINPTTGKTVGANNDRPPIANDIAVWRDRLFAGGITGFYRFTLQIIAVLGNQGIANTNTIALDGVTYTGTTGAVGANQYFLESASGSAAINIERTAMNLVEAINKSASNTTIYASYAAKPDDPLTVGRVDLVRRLPGGSAFTPRVGVGSKQDCFQPVLPTTGATNDEIAATVEAYPNGLRWSKPNQPDAFPAGNIAFLGAREKKILRIIPLRNRLWVFKEDGVFIGTGSTEADFDFHLWDPTIIVAGRDTVVTLDNEIYLLSTQGVLSVSESGRSLHSDPIDNILQDALAQYTQFGLTAGAPGFTSMQQSAFAVAVETDHRYVLCFPSSWNSTLGVPSQCDVTYTYNTRTKAWTKWTTPNAVAVSGATAVTAGLVDSGGRLLFTESNGNAATAYVYFENKLRGSADFYEFNSTGIIKTITFKVEVGRDPGATKQFGEVVALLDPTPADVPVEGMTLVSITCSSEQADGVADVTTRRSELARRTWPQIEVSRCARLAVTIGHSVAGEDFALAGIKVKWREYDGKVGR